MARFYQNKELHDMGIAFAYTYNNGGYEYTVRFDNGWKRVGCKAMAWYKRSEVVGNYTRTIYALVSYATLVACVIRWDGSCMEMPHFTLYANACAWMCSRTTTRHINVFLDNVVVFPIRKSEIDYEIEHSLSNNHTHLYIDALTGLPSGYADLDVNVTVDFKYSGDALSTVFDMLPTVEYHTDWNTTPKRIIGALS